MLLVQHHDPRDNKTFWMPPGGGSEGSEAFADAARREVKEETGIDVRVLRQAAVPPERGYLLFVAELAGVPNAIPEVEPCEDEIHTVGAGWHPVTDEAPLGPMESEYWAELAPLIRDLLREADA